MEKADDLINNATIIEVSSVKRIITANSSVNILHSREDLFTSYYTSLQRLVQVL
ncbi:hypothetical protein C1645_819738 [Glomus cerebriforme]|uniref:Uncharacterized protein n=1 Tax=Glomus cerebriforme TaxID=658196 RepID=A0A397TE88_9GLOM|nr:hypothetical protein C1645_819738 [Glomus cerebriforme]